MTAEAFATASPAPGAGDAVLDAFARMRAALDDVRQAVLWSRSDERARQGVAEGFALMQQTQSVWLGLLRDLDARPDAVPRARAGFIARTFLRERLHRTAAQAAADMKAALALAPTTDPGTGGLPELAKAFAAGRVSREHVDLAVRTVHKVPREALAAPMPTGTDVDRLPPNHPHGFDHLAPPDGRASPVGDEQANNGPSDSKDQTDAENRYPEMTSAPDQDPSRPNAAAPDRTANDVPGRDDVNEPTAHERSGGEAVDAYLAHISQVHDPAATRNLTRHLLDALDPDGAESFNPDAVDKRSVSYAKDIEGMVVGRFHLDPVSGAWFVEAIEHFSTPDPTRKETAADGSTTEVKDRRTAGQRRADALGALSRIALGSTEAGTTGGESPRIVIHTGVDDFHDSQHPHHDTGAEPAADGKPDAGVPTNITPDAGKHDDGKPDDAGPAHDNGCVGSSQPGPDGSADTSTRLRPADVRAENGAKPGRRERPGIGFPETSHGQPVSPGLLARFGCDSVLQAVFLARNGAILDLGRDVRIATRAQRRALIARDRGCAVPGCPVPPSRCDAHHVQFFRNGGRTDIANLALLCDRHHTDVHLGLWTLHMIHGLPWCRPPTWIHPRQPLIRNTYHDTAAQARDLGTQLHLNLTPEDPPPWLVDPPNTTEQNTFEGDAMTDREGRPENLTTDRPSADGLDASEGHGTAEHASTSDRTDTVSGSEGRSAAEDAITSEPARTDDGDVSDDAGSTVSGGKPDGGHHGPRSGSP